MYTKGTKVLQHPNHNGVQIFWSFAILKISIQLLPMVEDKHMLYLESNARKFIEEFNNHWTAMISQEMTQL